MRTELLQSYIFQFERAGKGASRRQKSISNYLEFIAVHCFDRFNYETLLIWLRERGKSLGERAIATEQNHIADFAKWAQLFDRSIGKIPKYGRVRVDRRVPVRISESQIVKIMEIQKALPSRKGINCVTYPVITGLIYATGLRINEAVRMKRANLDLEEGTIYVPSGKGVRDRIVPLSPSTVCELRKYEKWRNKTRFNEELFFIHDKEVPKNPEGTYRINFNLAAAKIDLRDSKLEGYHRTNLTVHDLRHNFAVSSMIRAYEQGADVNEAVVQLSCVLGHEKLDNTYWYVENVPELISAAFSRVST